MREFQKIHSIFKRDEKSHRFIEGEWATPEIAYLAECNWEWTEKVDGTNIRVDWNGNSLELGGRTAAAQIPATLVQRLSELFRPDAFGDYTDGITLYGEGYGAKIQKGGGNYKEDGVDFVLFDVLVGDWWLRREDVEEVAAKLGIKCVPVVGAGPIMAAVALVRDGLKSHWGDFQAEGLVLRTPIGLLNRAGHRVLTKLKGKDWPVPSGAYK